MGPCRETGGLSPILLADLVGCSRLMGDDERATLRTLTAHRMVHFVVAEQGRQGPNSRGKASGGGKPLHQEVLE